MTDLKGVIMNKAKSMHKTKGYTWMTLNKIIFSYLNRKANQFCLNVTLYNLSVMRKGMISNFIILINNLILVNLALAVIREQKIVSMGTDAVTGVAERNFLKK